MAAIRSHFVNVSMGEHFSSCLSYKWNCTAMVNQGGNNEPQDKRGSFTGRESGR